MIVAKQIVGSMSILAHMSIGPRWLKILPIHQPQDQAVATDREQFVRTVGLAPPPAEELAPIMVVFAIGSK